MFMQGAFILRSACSLCVYRIIRLDGYSVQVLLHDNRGKNIFSYKKYKNIKYNIYTI